MTDLKKIFGGEYTPPVLLPAEQQLRNAIAASGLRPPDEIIFDSTLRRFSGNGDKKTDCWIVAHDGLIKIAIFGDWRTGIETKWREDKGSIVDEHEELATIKSIAAARAKREEIEQKLTATAAGVCQKIWDSAENATADHPYLKRKSVQAHGIKITGDGKLIIPMYNAAGAISSLQYIDNAGNKRFHQHGKVKACLFQIGDTITNPIYIVEGYATGATVYEVTGKSVAVAFSAGNLAPVTGILRNALGSADLVVVADNDASGTGESHAQQACAAHGARYVIPPILGDANDYVQAGCDLAALLAPPSQNWLIAADIFCEKPAPIEWLVKHWVQKNALIMIHGPSGCGKTFVALDACCCIASQVASWCGQSVHGGPVVYLAGEGHHGLRGRLAAWKLAHGIDHLDFWISQSGCNLNTPDGFKIAANAIRSLPVKPVLVSVDTLHRFLDGDENSAEDTKTMLDACALLQAEFSCSVLLIHHTGISNEAQHRARGSSAWRGALDIEINLIPAKKEGDPIQIRQVKNKDSEIAKSIFVSLDRRELPGWIDEDGEQVASAVVRHLAEYNLQEQKKETKLAQYIKTLQRAWFASDAELLAGHPYISRDALIKFLIENDGMTEKAAAQQARPAGGRLITSLLNAEILTAHLNGWEIIDDAIAAAWTILKTQN